MNECSPLKLICLKRIFHQLHNELCFIQIGHFKAKLQSFFWTHQFSTWATPVYQSATTHNQIDWLEPNQNALQCNYYIINKYNTKVSVLFIFMKLWNKWLKAFRGKNATNRYKKSLKVIKMLHLNEALKFALDLFNTVDRITNCKVESIKWARH